MTSFLLLPTAKMVNNIYYIFTALPALFAIFLLRKEALLKTEHVIGWTILIGWFLFVGTIEADFQFLKHVLYVALFLLAVSQFVDLKFFNTPLFARLLFWSAILYVTASSVFYWITGHYAFGSRVVMLPMRMDSSIYTSMWITSCFALALPTWMSQRRYIELGTGLALAIFLMSFSLQSRSGIASLIALLIACSFLLAISNKKTGLLTLAVFVFVLGFLWMFTKDIPQIGQLVARGDALRFELWTALIREWSNCGILMGCGLAHESEYILTGGGGILHPHNIYLALGLYTGLVSLLIFLALMCLALYQAWQQRNPWGLYLFASLVALNFDGSKLIGNPDELWLLVLLPAALIIHRDNTVQARPVS